LQIQKETAQLDIIATVAILYLIQDFAKLGITVLRVFRRRYLVLWVHTLQMKGGQRLRTVCLVQLDFTAHY